MDFCQLDMKVKEYWKIIREAEERTASLNADIQNMKCLNLALLNKVKQIRYIPVFLILLLYFYMDLCI